MTNNSKDKHSWKYSFENGSSILFCSDCGIPESRIPNYQYPPCKKAKGTQDKKECKMWVVQGKCFGGLGSYLIGGVTRDHVKQLIAEHNRLSCKNPTVKNSRKYWEKHLRKDYKIIKVRVIYG